MAAAVQPRAPWISRYQTAGLAALAAGTVLGLVAFLTNPVPDPSFPWATLPASYRLPVTQPRIEHWPVTYTLGIWLWVFGLPAVFLAAAHRASRPAWTRHWRTTLPALTMLALTTYCRFYWPKLQPPTWNAPSYTFVCWLYCSSYDPAWSNAAYAVGLLGVLAAVRARSDTDRATVALATFGVLALPLGLPAIVEAARRHAGQQSPA